MTRSLPLTRAALTALCTGLLAGCDSYADPCFAPQSVVSDRRILAVAAEPPEARIDPTTGIAEPVSLRALVVEPFFQSQSVHASWSFCPVDAVQAFCPPAAVSSTEDQWTPHSTALLVASPELIAAAVAADPLRGLRGIKLRAGLEVSGASPAQATSLVRLTRSNTPVNHSPRLQGVRLLREIGGTPELIDSNGLISLTVGKTIGLRPVLAPDAIEEYDTLDLNGNPIHLREHLTYSFYADSTLFFGQLLGTQLGGQGVEVYSGVDGSQADEPDGAAEPPLGLVAVSGVHAGGSSGVLWIVVRDSRGGTSWAELHYRSVEERPACLGPLPHFGCPKLDLACQ